MSELPHSIHGRAATVCCPGVSALLQPRATTLRTWRKADKTLAAGRGRGDCHVLPAWRAFEIIPQGQIGSMMSFRTLPME